ncbi:MAG: hypothetical protein JW774_08760 [Candidatus Aureabacteria bacterium]|nr:hypothetical protein [Candidatus Auribacterota bacterium]
MKKLNLFFIINLILVLSPASVFALAPVTQQSQGLSKEANKQWAVYKGNQIAGRKWYGDQYFMQGKLMDVVLAEQTGISLAEISPQDSEAFDIGTDDKTFVVLLDQSGNLSLTLHLKNEKGSFPTGIHLFSTQQEDAEKINWEFFSQQLQSINLGTAVQQEKMGSGDTDVSQLEKVIKKEVKAIALLKRRSKAAPVLHARSVESCIPSMDEFMRVILTLDPNKTPEEYTEDPILAHFAGKGKQNLIRGDIEEEILFIDDKIYGEDASRPRVSLDFLSEKLITEGTRFMEEGDHLMEEPSEENFRHANASYKKAVSCFFHALRCEMAAEDITSFLQLRSIQSEAINRIREMLFNAISKRTQAIPFSNLLELARLWKSKENNIFLLWKWVQDNTNIADLHWFVDKGDAFWDGYSRHDLNCESCLALDHLEHAPESLALLTHSLPGMPRTYMDGTWYGYFNSRRKDGSVRPDLQGGELTRLQKRFREIDQNGTDETIKKVIFLTNMLKDYSRILLGDDSANIERILRPLLEKTKEISKEDIELIITLSREHRDNRSLFSGDGGVRPIINKLKTSEKGQAGAKEFTYPELVVPDRGALEDLTGAFSEPQPDEALSRLLDMKTEKGNRMTKAMTWLGMLNRDKYTGLEYVGVTILHHCVRLNHFMRLFEFRQYDDFNRERRENRLPAIPESHLEPIAVSLDHVFDYMSSPQIGFPRDMVHKIVHAITFFHDIGDIHDSGDHMKRGEQMIEAALNTVGLDPVTLGENYARVISWAKFIARNHGLGGLIGGEQPSRPLTSALEEFKNPEEKEMLFQFVKIVYSADLLSYEDGNRFDKDVAEYVSGLHDIGALKEKDEFENRIRRLVGKNKRKQDKVVRQLQSIRQQVLETEGGDHFAQFISEAELDHCRPVFANLQDIHITQLLYLFYKIQKASGGTITGFHFTSSRTQAKLDRRFIERLFDFDQDEDRRFNVFRLTDTDFDGIIAMLQRKIGLGTNVKDGNTLYIDDRFMNYLYRYWLASGFIDLAYYTGRGTGTLTDHHIGNILFLQELGNMEEFMSLDQFYPFARLLYGYLGIVVKRETKGFYLGDARTFAAKQSTDEKTKDLNQSQLLVYLTGQLVDANPAFASQYREVLEMFQELQRQDPAHLTLLLDWLRENRTIRFRYMCENVDFGPKGLITFCYALARLWDAQGRKETTYFFNTAFERDSPKVPREKLKFCQESWEDVISAASRINSPDGFSAEAFIRTVLGLKMPTEFDQKGNTVVINFAPRLHISTFSDIHHRDPQTFLAGEQLNDLRRIKGLLKTASLTEKDLNRVLRQLKIPKERFMEIMEALSEEDEKGLILQHLDALLPPSVVRQAS